MPPNQYPQCITPIHVSENTLSTFELPACAAAFHQQPGRERNRLVGVEKLSAWTDLVRAGEVLLSIFSRFLGGESLWCCRWA